jgi:outer membrane receptor protein involved in Fe transport
MSFQLPGCLIRPGIARYGVAMALVLGCLFSVTHAAAATLGKIGGRIVTTDTGEPVAYADVSLVPADTTMKRVGGLTNADGTFLLEALPGRYTLQVRALSYATKKIEAIEIKEGELLPFSTALAPEALQQEEIVVEAKRAENTEASMLAARKKAPSVGDAISAEQVRKSADRDAAEVLRRVTGLSVSDGKYVFVRGLGERYSSTEIDGVRIASPEENKRVVPLDLVPSNLLENIVVQKTYTADRPGEFGGGDVQVRTKDFPGRRTWTLEVVQGYAEGVTFGDRMSYGTYKGFGADSRAMPSSVDGVTLPVYSPAAKPELAAMARSFANIWSPTSTGTAPNGRYSATYGDEVRLFGRPVGLILSSTFSRAFDVQEESQRLFRAETDTIYDYAVTRWTDVAQLAGLGGLSYRLSPAHSLHLRGLYTSTADDEVRIYEGKDHNSTEAFSEQWQHRRNTRLLFAQRTVMSGSLEGRHQFASLLGSGVDWKLGRSRAKRDQPDRRDITYNRQFWYDGDTAHWVLGSQGSREYGELNEDGWGAAIKTETPFRLWGLGNGKVAAGFDRQNKERDNFYRRFRLVIDPRFVNTEALPESIFAPGTFNGDPNSGYLSDLTYNDPVVGVDNYTAQQRVTAGFLSFDVPFGSQVRANLGVRVEHGFQNVESFALFDPDSVLLEGKLDDTDWLPSANLTWAFTQTANLRLAASRTISRPDLNELSPSPFPEFIGGYYVKGNPDLSRALLDNYDARIEAFPGLSEVVAAGVFYKKLREPIEQVIRAGSPPLLVPENSASGYNRGIELEARVGLGRVWRPLERFTFNSNATLIDSKVNLYPTVSRTGSSEHPLQGQADYLVNLGLGYVVPGRLDATVLANSIGKRLRALGYEPLPDMYDQAYTSMDAALNLMLFRNARVKMTARNLLDPTIQRLQGEREVSSYKSGRTYSISFVMGS